MKVKFIIGMLAALATSAVMFGFTSNGVYSYGKADTEFTMAVVADNNTITAGQWVMLDMADTLGVDTCATVTNDNSGAENSALVLGVAENGGSQGAMIRVITRGYALAYINGSDSVSGSAGITPGTSIALSTVDGAAGALVSTAGVGTTAAQAAAAKVCGVALETIASTDTGLYNKYEVYVTVR